MNLLQENTSREILLKIFSHALRSVNGENCVHAYFKQHPLPGEKVRVIAIGKAAASMMQGVLNQHIYQIEAGLVITKDGHSGLFDPTLVPITQIESGHPYADERSLEAGSQLLCFIKDTPANVGLLFLVSGGSSALVEVLPTGVQIEQLQRMNRWLLAKGWPIDVMNRVRKSVSLIKAGRLARYVSGHRVLQLLISDVPGNDLSVIGSGLLVPDLPASIPEQLPDWIHQMQTAIPPAPPANDACFGSIQNQIIASNELAREAAVIMVRESGLRVCCNEPLSGEAAMQGHRIAKLLREGPTGVYIWGGETVVNLPEQPGQGGRCQHLALAAALELAGDPGTMLLAVGTDGTDGPGDAAGALIDGKTIERARDADAPDPVIALQRADAGSFLAASGDLIDTGPTGTNVMDLVIGLKYSIE